MSTRRSQKCSKSKTECSLKPPQWLHVVRHFQLSRLLSPCVVWGQLFTVPHGMHHQILNLFIWGSFKLIYYFLLSRLKNARHPHFSLKGSQKRGERDLGIFLPKQRGTCRKFPNFIIFLNYLGFVSVHRMSFYTTSRFLRPIETQPKPKRNRITTHFDHHSPLFHLPFSWSNHFSLFCNPFCCYVIPLGAGLRWFIFRCPRRLDF